MLRDYARHDLRSATYDLLFAREIYPTSSGSGSLCVNRRQLRRILGAFWYGFGPGDRLEASELTDVRGWVE